MTSLRSLIRYLKDIKDVSGHTKLSDKKKKFKQMPLGKIKKKRAEICLRWGRFNMTLPIKSRIQGISNKFNANIFFYTQTDDSTKVLVITHTKETWRKTVCKEMS